MTSFVVSCFYKIYDKTLKQEKSYKLVYEIAQNEIVKFEVFVNDTNFFDFTLQLNMFKLHLSTSSVNFLQQLKNSTIKYQKQNIFDLLDKCFRDFAYK